jgi:hypothetical protein
VLNVGALAATVWAAHRRLGLRGALLVGAGLAPLIRLYGTALIVYPWNPFLPVLFWVGGSAGLGLLLAPPVFVEQLGGDPGNLAIIVENFRHPAEAPEGLGAARSLFLDHLNVVTEPDRELMAVGLSDQLGELVGPVVRAVEDGDVAGGPDGTFLVTWIDPVNLGSQGFGLMLEMERAGIDVKAPEPMRLGVRDHRVVKPGEADAEIHLAVGLAAIEEARARRGSAQLAYDDPRTPAERQEVDRLRAELTAGLTAAGITDLVPLIDDNLLALLTDPRLPQELSRLAYFLSITPQPVAVFSSPVQP